MKKITLLVLITILFNTITKATDYENVVKFLPQNLYFNSATFEWEHAHRGKNAFTIGVGLPMTASLFGRFCIEEDDFHKANWGSSSLRIAYRWYSNKTTPYGFYVEAAAKTQYSLITGSMPDPNQGQIKANLTTGSLGFQLGYQTVIAERFTFDIYFLGLEGGIAGGRARSISTDSQSGAYMQDYMVKNVDLFMPKMVSKKFEATAADKIVHAKLNNFFYPWIRCGFSFGFRF